MAGQPPPTETHVSQSVTLERGRPSDTAGMDDKGYRELALKQFLAFKVLAKSHWMKILDGI